MKWSEVTPVLVALLVLIGALWQGRRPRFDSRDRLQRDLELLAAMPNDLQVKDEYKQHISAAFEALINDEDKRTRDPRGVVLGIVLMLVGGWLVWLALDHGGGWWHFLTVFGALLFAVAAVGTAQDSSKHHRDERGRVISRSDSADD
jgi:hypothetical protein